MLLRLHQGRVVDACHSALIARDDIQGFGARECGRLWYGVANLVVATGNLSKSFFGSGPERERIYEERAPLRESLDVDDSSPLRQVKIRNDFEHLDERLDKWWRDSPNHNVVDAMVGPDDLVGGDPGVFGDKDFLRWLNPETGKVIFWGNELHIPSVMQEILRILPIAEREHQKPHWEALDRASDGE